jgi:hypothetical protein
MHHPDALPRNGDDGANNGIIVLFDALISVLGSGIEVDGVTLAKFQKIIACFQQLKRSATL